MTAILDLDRRMSRALAEGRGMKFTADQLDALASLGTLTLIADAKAAILKEQARCRAMKRQSIDGANTGSDPTFGPTGPRGVPTSPSSGTTPPPDERAAEAQKRRR